MGIRQYRLGLRHGRDGIRALAHRKLRQYDSRSANESYLLGYREGCQERYLIEKKVGLDYSSPLNTQMFDKQ